MNFENKIYTLINMLSTWYVAVVFMDLCLLFYFFCNLFSGVDFVDAEIQKWTGLNKSFFVLGGYLFFISFYYFFILDLMIKFILFPMFRGFRNFCVGMQTKKGRKTNNSFKPIFKKEINNEDIKKTRHVYSFIVLIYLIPIWEGITGHGFVYNNIIRLHLYLVCSVYVLLNVPLVKIIWHDYDKEDKIDSTGLYDVDDPEYFRKSKFR